MPSSTDAVRPASMSSVIEISSSDNRRNISRSSCGKPSSAAVTRVGNSNVTALTRSASPSFLNSSTSWSQIGSITSGSHCASALCLKALLTRLRWSWCCLPCMPRIVGPKTRPIVLLYISEPNTVVLAEGREDALEVEQRPLFGALELRRHQVALHERAAPHRRRLAHVLEVGIGIVHQIGARSTGRANRC